MNAPEVCVRVEDKHSIAGWMLSSFMIGEMDQVYHVSVMSILIQQRHGGPG